MVHNRVRLATCNFERNGGGDRTRWQRMHALLASLQIDLLLRQEMIGCEDPASGLWQDSKTALGMDGHLAPNMGATAVYWNPETLELSPTRDATWRGVKDWPMWWLHPAGVTLRVRGTDDVDFVAASVHLTPDSATQRLAESESATRFADRYSRQRGCALPAVVGGDYNSYTAGPPLPGEEPTPSPKAIADLRHLVHRSYLNTSGQRVMDDGPDRTLTAAGLADAARHFARTTPGTAGERAVGPTAPTPEFARVGQGPPRRIDRIYLTKQLAPAITHVEVVDPEGLTDHRIVLLDLARDVFIDICHNYKLAA